MVRVIRAIRKLHYIICWRVRFRGRLAGLGWVRFGGECAAERVLGWGTISYVIASYGCPRSSAGFVVGFWVMYCFLRLSNCDSW